MTTCSGEDDNISDDEVFFGPLTLKEIKKHIMFHDHRQTISCFTENNRCDRSDENIEVMEENINNKENIELNDTLEIVECILNNPPSKNNSTKSISKENEINKEENEIEIVHERTKLTNINNRNENFTSKNKNECKTVMKLQDQGLHSSPINKDALVEENTPNTPKEQDKPIFKTPENPVKLQNIATSTKKTPCKTSPYKHITSPVATYIKNCPLVPHLKDVHPKKTLPGTSFIPKIVKNTSDKSKNNVAPSGVTSSVATNIKNCPLAQHLKDVHPKKTLPGTSFIPKIVKNTSDKRKDNVVPSGAYKSANSKIMLTYCDKGKLPRSPSAKKLVSALPKPLVITHVHREFNSNKKSETNKKDNSYANLPLLQADMSICTQKVALPEP